MKTERTAATPQHESNGGITQSLVAFLHERGNFYLHRQIPVPDGFACHASPEGEKQLAMRYCNVGQTEQLRDLVILPQSEDPGDGITAFLAQATLWGGCTDDSEDWRGRIVHPDVVLITCADDDDRLAYYAALASRGLVKATLQIPASLIVRRPDCLDGLAILFATYTQKISLPQQLHDMDIHIPDHEETTWNPYRLRFKFCWRNDIWRVTLGAEGILDIERCEP